MVKVLKVCHTTLNLFSISIHNTKAIINTKQVAAWYCKISTILCTVGLLLNVWFNYCVLRFFAYIANSMIARIDAAAYGVLLLDSLLRFK